METLHACVAGMDVHKEFIMVCVRATRSNGTVKEDIRRFGTMTADLLAMVDCFSSMGVTHVAMESTGVLWKPIWNILEAHAFDMLLINARELKQVPGRKSDVKDCQWIAHLLACGLLKSSYVPARDQRELRDLTRHRAQLQSEHTRCANRIHKVLQDANVKLSSVATDILGKSGRDMLSALIDGESDPAALADLARGRLRKKIPELRRALQAHVQPHHQFMLEQLLDHLSFLEEHLHRFNEQIEEALRPFVDEATMTRLTAVPGIRRTTIENVVAEIGVDMSRFPTSAHLASWAGVCPGNEESAGKRKRQHTTHGDVWLKRALGEAAWGATKTKDTYFKAQYRRLAGRRGKKRAILAISHSLLTVIYHLLKDPDIQYNELGENYFDSLDPRRLQRHLVKRLESLGFEVNLKKRPAA